MPLYLPGHCWSSLSGALPEIIYWFKSPSAIGFDPLVGHSEGTEAGPPPCLLAGVGDGVWPEASTSTLFLTPALGSEPTASPGRQLSLRCSKRAEALCMVTFMHLWSS